MIDGSLKKRLLRALLYGGLTVLFVAPLLPAPEAGDTADRTLGDEIVRERESQEQWMRTSPTSFLAATQRVPFAGRTVLAVGSAPDNDVRLEGEDIAAHHVRISLRPEGFYSLEALDPDATFTVKDSPTRAHDTRGGSFRVGRFTLSLSPPGAPVVLVSDPGNARVQEFKGLQHFPFDRDLRFVVPLVLDEARSRVDLASTKGTVPAERVGWFDVTLDGSPRRLEVHRLLTPAVRSSEYLVAFRDATTGRETSPLGRYLDPLALPDGQYLLDFNRAYHSACVHSEHYECALPPAANALPVAIGAGARL